MILNVLFFELLLWSEVPGIIISRPVKLPIVTVLLGKSKPNIRSSYLSWV